MKRISFHIDENLLKLIDGHRGKSTRADVIRKALKKYYKDREELLSELPSPP